MRASKPHPVPAGCPTQYATIRRAEFASMSPMSHQKPPDSRTAPTRDRRASCNRPNPTDSPYVTLRFDEVHSQSGENARRRTARAASQGSSSPVPRVCRHPAHRQVAGAAPRPFDARFHRPAITRTGDSPTALPLSHSKPPDCRTTATHDRRASCNHLSPTDSPYVTLRNQPFGDPKMRLRILDDRYTPGMLTFRWDFLRMYLEVYQLPQSYKTHFEMEHSLSCANFLVPHACHLGRISLLCGLLSKPRRTPMEAGLLAAVRSRRWGSFWGDRLGGE